MSRPQPPRDQPDAETGAGLHDHASDNEAARVLARLSTRMFDVELPADHIGRFELRERLGAGAMGVVYAAWDPQLDRRVAIKLIHRAPGQAGPEADGQRRLLREAKAMARLRHPNVIQVHEVGTHEGQVFVAMEIIEGDSLRAWLGAREHSWREIVEVFTLAGRGLAAAHAAGLVHRDFKPDNVLVEGERVFVGDFGLARERPDPGESDHRTTLPELEPGATSDGFGTADGSGPGLGSETGLGSDPLTQTGAFVGTPAYMAPEAFSGARLDPRADQYGFCASLYEALYRTRPFSQRTLSSLTAAKQARALSAVDGPNTPKVPRWLYRVVVRGLAAEPEDRFNSMDDLLDALARGRRQARWRQRGLAAAGLLAAAVGLSVLTYNLRPTPGGLIPSLVSPLQVCAAAEHHLDGIWDSARRAEIDLAFAASDLDVARDLAPTVVEAIDAHAARWVLERRDACEATHLRGEQSAKVLDLRMRCLDRRLSEFDAILDRLESPTDQDIAKSLHAVDGLTPIETCGEVERLESTSPLPEDPTLRTQVATLRGDLDTVRAAIATNHHSQVEVLARETLEAAIALDYRPLTAEAGVTLGLILGRAGDAKEAAAVLEAAIVDAQASGHDQVAALAMITAIHVIGFRLRDLDGAERYIQQARAMIERIGDPLKERASYALNVGTVAYATGHDHEAQARFEEAMDHFAALNGPGHYSVAEARSNLAAIKRRQGKTEEALVLYLRSIGELEAALGTSHPGLVTTYNNLAVAYIILGRYDEAEATLERTIKLSARALPLDHPTSGHLYNNLGEVFTKQGRHTEAIVPYSKAIGIWMGALPSDHPLLAHPLAGRGYAELALGDLEAARTDFEQAHELRRDATVPEAALAETEFLLARSLAALHDDPRRQRELADAALEHMPEDEDGYLVDRAEIAAWIDGH